MVVPMRPVETDGLSEEELARLVTRDCMIGTGLPLRPGSLDPAALWPATGELGTAR
jgi:nitrile hydratase